MRHMLETDICIYAIRGHSRALLRRPRGFRTADIGVSAVTVAGLQSGVSKSQHRESS